MFQCILVLLFACVLYHSYIGNKGVMNMIRKLVNHLLAVEIFGEFANLPTPLYSSLSRGMVVAECSDRA